MQFSPNIGERRSKCIFAPFKFAFSFGKWVTEDRGPSFFEEKLNISKTKKKNFGRPLQRKCQYYGGFRLLFESLLAGKTEHKSKTSKFVNFQIFTLVVLDDTSNEIRRGLKFAV